MKFTEYLNEKKETINPFKYPPCPLSTRELKNVIEETIKLNGPDCDLNFINVVQITDMSHLFWKTKFTGDISKWNVSNVKNMEQMFRESDFNGDISKWDVSKV